jgi:septal ring factor EnvC (AmiA/AmiB activator)
MSGAAVVDLLTPEQRETAELEARLEAARTARAEHAKSVETQKRNERLREEAEAEERALKDEQILDELAAKHGPVGKKIRRVDTREGMIVVKAPPRAHFQRYQDKGATDEEAFQKLVRPCLLYPDKSRFDQICEEVPATLLKCANAVCALAGIGKEDVAGK